MKNYTSHDKAAAIGRLFAGKLILESERTDNHYEDVSKTIDYLLEQTANLEGFTVEEVVKIALDPNSHNEEQIHA